MKDVVKTEQNNNVYAVISRVQEALAKEGIAKNRRNEMQKYKFRGIDDVFNALSPLLAKEGLCILPNVLERSVTERHTQKGGVLFYVTVKVKYDFISVHDESRHEIIMYGEAMDSGDKATNKALSAAYKYACLQAFAIPTEGDNDADATTHGDIVPQPKKSGPMASTQAGHMVPIAETQAMLKEVKKRYGVMDVVQERYVKAIESQVASATGDKVLLTHKMYEALKLASAGGKNGADTPAPAPGDDPRFESPST